MAPLETQAPTWASVPWCSSPRFWVLLFAREDLPPFAHPALSDETPAMGSHGSDQRQLYFPQFNSPNYSPPGFQRIFRRGKTIPFTPASESALEHFTWDFRFGLRRVTFRFVLKAKKKPRPDRDVIRLLAGNGGPSWLRRRSVSATPFNALNWRAE
jgi:hypothetical protein